MHTLRKGKAYTAGASHLARYCAKVLADILYLSQMTNAVVENALRLIILDIQLLRFTEAAELKKKQLLWCF